MQSRCAQRMVRRGAETHQRTSARSRRSLQYHVVEGISRVFHAKFDKRAKHLRVMVGERLTEHSLAPQYADQYFKYI